MPLELRNLISGSLSRSGGKPDCADVSILLRHFYLKEKEQQYSFRVGPTRARSEEFTIGKNVRDSEVRACLIGTGTESFQETRPDFALVNYYRGAGRGRPIIRNLKSLVAAGLKPGDMFVWRRGIQAAGFQGHAQTIQAVVKPVTDPKDATRISTPGSITVVQGNMVGGRGVGQLQQRVYPFKALTGRDDGDADILDTDEETFFGAGPWKGAR
jgi:hypothetical protein